MALMTKNLLGESLKKFLEKKPLNKITVTEIVNDCGVNRQTFYYNFHDVYDLAEWVFQEETEKIIENSKALNDWQEGAFAVFEYLRKNKNIVLNTACSVNRMTLENSLKKCFRPVIMNIINSKIKEENHISDEDKNFIIDLYVVIFVAFAFEWLENDMYDNYEKNTDKMRKVISGSIQYLIDKFSDN